MSHKVMADLSLTPLVIVAVGVCIRRRGVSPGFDFVFSVLVKRLAGKSVSEMTYFVPSGMQNLNSINHSISDSQSRDDGMAVVSAGPHANHLRGFIRES